MNRKKEAPVDLGQWIVIGVSVGMLAWYIVASSYNRQREERTLRWIYKGLKPLGEPRRIRGASGKGLLPGFEVVKPSGAFRLIQVSYRMERRENPPLWIFQYFQGQRDELEVRARLKPQYEAGVSDQDRLEKLEESLTHFRAAITEIVLQRRDPNLIVRVRLREILIEEAADFFTALEAAAGNG
jgi:hypothetical protein